MSSGSAASASWRRQRAALGRQRERRQRALADDHRVHELDRHVAGVRARRRRAPAARAAARRARSARPSRGTAARCARPRRRRTRRSPPSAARPARPGAGPPRRRPCVTRRPPRAPARRPASRGSSSTPSPVRALTSDALGRPGAPRRGWRRKRVEVEVEVRQQVDLVDHHQLAGAEHQRVLERLVLALGDRGDHDPRVLADPELGRADEVADVLDDQQVDLVERQRRQRRADHVRVEVALAAEAGSVLSWTTGTCSAASRSASRLPCTSPSSTPTRTPPGRGSDPLEQRRLARARRAHQVDDRHAGAVEVVAVGLRRSCCWRRARPRRP